MIDKLKNIFTIPDLRRRIFYTFGLLLVYRLGAHIPTPGVNSEALYELFQQQGGQLLGFIDMFSGGALSRLTIFALGIMPYISASIIIQLLTVVWPYLEELNKMGPEGRKKITQYTRYGTVGICIVQSVGISLWIEKVQGGRLVLEPGWSFRLMAVLTLTTGTIFIMWLGEQITARGIGNGISLIIFSGIVVRLPSAIVSTISDLRGGTVSLFTILLLSAFMALVIAFIIFVERGQRRIPVQYAKRVVGRKLMGGRNTHLPLKVNTAGVIPVIFAASVIMFPPTIAQFPGFREIEWIRALANQLTYGMPLYVLFYGTAIIFFTFFYTSIVFNPVDFAENVKKHGGFIPGIRPGRRTAEFIDRVLTRVTTGGALYLAAVSILPMFLMSGFKVYPLPFIGTTLSQWLPEFVTQGLGVSFFFGGTSLLIVIGVAMDFMQQLESQLLMRHYDGFLTTGRLRGRRG